MLSDIGLCKNCGGYGEVIIQISEDMAENRTCSRCIGSGLEPGENSKISSEKIKQALKKATEAMEKL